MAEGARLRGWRSGVAVSVTAAVLVGVGWTAARPGTAVAQVDVDEADVVMTVKSEYRQKTPMLREAEERAMPVYVLKSNTQVQIQASLTSIFALEIDPREAALRETEDAIDLVLQRSEPVELSPQNAFIRRLQHQIRLTGAPHARVDPNAHPERRAAVTALWVHVFGEPWL